MPSQTPQERRVPQDTNFTYGNGNLEKWYLANGIDSEFQAARKTFKRIDPLTRAPQDYVLVSGNFAAENTVRGIGTTTSSQSTNLITIETSVGLVFTTSGFGVIRNGLNVASSTAGTVAYEMTVLSGKVNNLGAIVSGPITGTDSGINAKTLTIANPPGNSKKDFVLRLRRTLTMTQLAKGGEVYTATGTLILSVN